MRAQLLDLGEALFREGQLAALLPLFRLAGASASNPGAQFLMVRLCNLC